MLNRFVDGVRRSAFFNALAIFLASGWVVLQILDAFIDNGLLPDWTFRGAVVLLLPRDGQPPDLTVPRSRMRWRTPAASHTPGAAAVC
jgi:hypothetical protein